LLLPVCNILMVCFGLNRVINFFAPWNVVWPVITFRMSLCHNLCVWPMLQIIMQHLCFMRNKKSEKCNLFDLGLSIDRFGEGHGTSSTVQTVLDL